MELFDREPGIANKTTHRERVDWIVPGEGENPLSIGHHDVLALARDPESGLFEGSHSIEMIDAGNLGHGLHRDFDFANLFALELLFNYG